ncbi:folate transporter 1, chloroplastic isoform X2 [Olea europaea var. sylvestris]|uniref:folate transporter 1, chloroplastic isoform X2 n=1 Tax=Olea europaea var. sylvestris TaxID=158386 RepID=UPI000C1D8987|nr:folate transporter 1, chloroplastic isoform X2 [Olea europaea var. sylvestris]
MKEEGWRALYKGLVPGLFLVTHGAIQFTTYEELRKFAINYRTDGSEINSITADTSLDSFDYAILGASSKLAAILSTYPFQVIRARLQQRPSTEGIPRYMDSLHVVKDTARFEGVRGFYKGITANVLKNAPAASITFIVYENVLNTLKFRRKD